MRVAEIAKAAGLAPYVVEKSLPLVRKFTFAQLEATHRRLLDIDASLKQSKMTPEMALDLLVCEFGTVAPSGLTAPTGPI
jgi:DNA polymerase-3 subunit delta